MQHQVPPRRRTRYAGYCRILFSDVAAVFSASSSKTCAIFLYIPSRTYIYHSLRYRSFSSPLFPSYPAHVLLLVESHRRTVPFIHRISPFLATHQHDPIVLEDKTSYGETTSGISLSSQNMRQTPRSSPASVFRAFFAVLGRRLPTPSSAHSCHSLASSLPVFWNVMLVLFVPQVPPCPCGRSKMARTRTIQDPHPFAIRPLGSNSSQPSDWSPMWVIGSMTKVARRMVIRSDPSVLLTSQERAKRQISSYLGFPRPRVFGNKSAPFCLR